MCQQDKKSTESISERLESGLLNLKLAGGNMNVEELRAKGKVTNHSRSDEYTAVIGEENLMGTLLI